jgi:hypothetical protein
VQEGRSLFCGEQALCGETSWPLRARKFLPETGRNSSEACRTSSVLESADRSLVNQTQAAPATTDADREAMQLTVRDSTSTPVAAPTSHPTLSVDTSERLRHVVRFMDSVVLKRGKPAGVFGCELWHKLGGAPPVDFRECQPLGTDTASPYLAEYEGADAGKIVHYLGRWVSTRGDHGPWSPVVSATLTG